MAAQSATSTTIDERWGLKVRGSEGAPDGGLEVRGEASEFMPVRHYTGRARYGRS
jgi:hypothetical protein